MTLMYDFLSIKVRSTVDIPKGEMLYATYTFTLTGTQSRQEHLKKGKYFTCNCKRCTDPSELDTHFSTLKCQKCEIGNIMSSNPLGKYKFCGSIEYFKYLAYVKSYR